MYLTFIRLYGPELQLHTVNYLGVLRYYLTMEIYSYLLLL